MTLGSTLTEAKELKFEKPLDDLFEVPSNYRIVQTVITSEDDLQKEPPITLSDIQELLFENMKSINILLSRDKQFRELSTEEVDILKSAIKNGTELLEAKNNEVYKVSSNPTNIFFYVKWFGNEGCNNRYDKESGFMYVDKINVHRKDQEKHKFDSNWIKRYLADAYKFKPSEEIIKILK